MFRYNAELVRVVDGDTLDAMVDLGFNVWIKVRVRLAGINAFESRTRDKEEKAKGLRAKMWLEDTLEDHDNEFVVVSTEVGKYGRCLGHIFVGDDLDYSVNLRLIDEGHAVPYK